MAGNKRGAMVDRHCGGCGCRFTARQADVARGWGRFCSKRCAANPKKREGGRKLAMTRVMQTTYGGGDDPDPENRGDCFPACVASVLGLESADGIPRWYGVDSTGDQESNWWAIVAWLQGRGCTILAWEWPVSDFMARSLAGAAVIVSGVSPRFREGLHAVVGQVQADGTLRMLHDPHPSGDFIVGNPTMIELVMPLVAP